MKTPRFLPLLAACFLALSASVPASGQVLYETNFNGTDGELPPSWLAMSGDEIIALRENRLRLSRHGRPGTGVARTVMYRGLSASNWADYVVEATFRQSRTGDGNERNGLLARWNGERGLPVAAYFAYVSGDRLLIARGAGRGNDTTPVLGQAAIEGDFRANRSYTLRFTLVGPRLTAELFDARGNAMAKVEAEDDTFKRGSVGMQAYFTFGERWADYEHLVVYRPR